MMTKNKELLKLTLNERKSHIGAFHTSYASVKNRSDKGYYYCQNIQLNGHSTPIKDFWGVVVESKVMPRTINNSGCVYLKLLA